MKHRNGWRCQAILFVLVLAGASSASSAQEPALGIELTALKERYFLGEAVTIELAFKNNTNHDVQTFRRTEDYVERQGVFLISRDRQPGVQFGLSENRMYCVTPSFEVLKPRDHCTCPLSLQYAWRLSELRSPASEKEARDLETPQPMFARPGSYRITVLFPLPCEGSTVEMIASNVVHIQVDAPIGAASWARRSARGTHFDLMPFLPAERAASGFVDGVRFRYGGLLRDHPKRRVKAPLLAASGIFHDEQGDLSNLVEDETEARTFLGLQDAVLFPDDERLSGEITMHFLSLTPLSDVLAFYTQQSDVPLEAAPSLRENRISAPYHLVELRQEMRVRAGDVGARWERRGTGYYLRAENGKKESDPPPVSP